MLNALLDSAHKIIRPSTYPCSLCRITHNHTVMSSEWKKFISSLEVRSIFLHSDELDTYDMNQFKNELPVIILEREGLRETLISSDEMNDLDVSSLIVQLKTKLDARLKA